MKSISHPEMYVPGIPLPDGISEPAERMTVSRILTGTFSSDTHPPGYYLLMLPWTRVMGTSLSAIRLPSALLGIASIPLIFWFGSLAGCRMAGSVAAALLAFSGYHVFWSKVARMFALGCFLGLAASVLLLLIARSSRSRPILITAYVLTVVAGVATHVFFWSLFAAHVVWAFSNAAGRGKLPDLCRAQLLALVLGSPLIAFAVYQSGNTVADLSSNALIFLAEFLPFAFALPSSGSGSFPSAIPLTQNAISWVVRGGLLMLALSFFIIGLRRLSRSAARTEMALRGSSGARLWRTIWLAGGAIATVEICGFVLLARRLPPEFVNSTIRATQALAILPLVLAAMAVLLEKTWRLVSASERWKQWTGGEGGLIVLLATMPLVILSVLAQLRPILNQRGLLFAAPYLLLLLSIGLVSVPGRLRIATLAPVLVLMCMASIRSYSTMTVDPADYGQFAKAITSEIGTNDLVFIRKAWYETPILFYLHKDHYRLVGRDFERLCARNREARVWVVLLYDSDPADDMKSALAGYRMVKTITAPYAKALLYESGQG
jgi:uncharacterized membrane protein